MARTDATILAAQKTYSVDPYIPIAYYTTGRPSDAGGSWTQLDTVSSIARIEKIDPWYEGAFSSRAVIYLDNSDSAFDAYDLKGKWIRIGKGYGSNVSYPAYFKINDDFFISDIGTDTYVVDCYGAWEILEEYRNPSHLFFNQSDLDATRDGMTGKDILNEILEAAGLDLGASISEDTYIDSWEPEFTFPAGMTGKSMILEVLSIYRCALIPRTDCMHILHLNTGGTYTYVIPELATYHPAIGGYKYNTNYSPMKVVVNDATGTYTGNYADSDWASTMGYITWTDRYDVVTHNDHATHIATAEVEKSAQRAVVGVVDVWIVNCLEELYDTVTATDNRGNTGQSAVVGGISHPYYPGQRWSMRVQLGGLYTENPSASTSTSNYSYGVSSGIPGNALIQNSVTADQIMANTITASEILANTITANEIAANTITASEILANTITANEIAANTITTGELAFTAYVIGTNDLDDVVNGSTYGRVLNTNISAGHIVLSDCTGDLDDIDNGTSYGRVALTDISAGHIVLSTCDGDLDDVSDGSTYGKVRQTILGSGYIQVGTGTKDQADPGGLDGWHISSTEIVGQLAGADQCVFNTSGQITAGAGAVILDANGLIIRDASASYEKLQFQNSSSVLKANIGLNASEELNIYSVNDAYISTAANKAIYITAGNGAMIALGSASIRMANLPDADPEVAGVLWNDGGTVKISAG